MASCDIAGENPDHSQRQIHSVYQYLHSRLLHQLRAVLVCLIVSILLPTQHFLRQINSLSAWAVRPLSIISSTINTCLSVNVGVQIFDNFYRSRRFCVVAVAGDRHEINFHIAIHRLYQVDHKRRRRRVKCPRQQDFYRDNPRSIFPKFLNCCFYFFVCK